MKKYAISALGFLMIVGLSACSNPFAKPLTFEQAYEGLFISSEAESILAQIGDMTHSEQNLKLDASFDGGIGSGSFSMETNGKWETGTGIMNSKSDGSMTLSGKLTMPIMGTEKDTIEANTKVDFKMVGGKIYVRLDALKASSPNAKLGDQIGAGLGVVNGALGGKWLVIDLAKYQAITESEMIDPLSIGELMSLQKTANELMKKYPFLKNNGEITEGNTKGFAVSLNTENILSFYTEITKNPSIKKMTKGMSEDEIKSNGLSLKESLDSVKFSGKLLPYGSDNIELVISELTIGNDVKTTGKIAKKDGKSNINLTANTARPNTDGSGSTKESVIIDMNGTIKDLNGTVRVLEGEKTILSLEAKIAGKVSTSGMQVSGDIRASGELPGSTDKNEKNELKIHFEQNTKSIPSFEVSIPEGARSIEEVMESFGLGVPSAPVGETGLTEEDINQEELPPVDAKKMK